MSRNTNIGWTQDSWNPIRGTLGAWHCVKISEGCKNCYAAGMNMRLHKGPDYRVGADTPRLDEKALMLPLKWKSPRMVFVCSMTDLFLDEHTDEMIDRIFAVMALCPQHTFQVLTKRPERMRDYCNARLLGLPLPNVWLGVSAENQERANERIPVLLDTPAAVRWVSAEPLLGPIDFLDERGLEFGDPCAINYLRGLDGVEPQIPGIDWVVVGGESGAHRRGCEIEWIADIAAQCERADVPVFVKQDNAFQSEQQGRIPDELWSRKQLPAISHAGATP